MIIWAIAKTTIGDALRKKVLQVFVVVAIALIVLSLSFSGTMEFSSHSGMSSDFMLLKSFGLGLMALAGIFISLILGVSLIPQEFERRTIYTILAKPVRRYEFITGKFVGALSTLGITTALMGLTFILTVVAKAIVAQHVTSAPTVAALPTAPSSTGIPFDTVQIFDWNMVWGVILIYLQFMMLSSIVLLFSLIFTTTVNFFMGAAVYMVGFMSTVVQSLGGAKDAGPFLKWLFTVLYWVLPRFDEFNIPNQLLHPDKMGTNMPIYTLGMTLYALLFTTGALVVAILVFERKEV